MSSFPHPDTALLFESITQATAFIGQRQTTGVDQTRRAEATTHDMNWRNWTGVFLLAVLFVFVLTLPAGADPVAVSDRQTNETTATSGFNSSNVSHAAASELDAHALQSGPNIQLTMELSLLSDRKGVYEVEQGYELPTNLGSLEARLPETATVTAVDGFVHRDDRTYEWDGTTPEPSLTYEQQGNRSTDQTGPIAGPGSLVFVDVGDWALVQRPQVAHQWRWQGEQVGLDRQLTTEEGVASDVMAYLGEYEKHTHEAHGQEFQLVVPETASLAADRAELFEVLADSSDTLRVGDRDEEVFMVAAPTGNIDWGVRGLQIGPADMWARDIERLNDPDNVWLHEYVHTRQDYTTASDLHWFTEGVATYYAALLTYEQDRISFQELRERLAVGTQSRFSRAILANPGTWASGTDYNVGALVSGALDRQLRLGTEGERSFQEVFRRMNAHDGVVTADDFERFLNDAGSGNIASLGKTYTETTERPVLWDQSQHNEAFGATPARITYSHPTPDRPRVSGPYRDRVIDSEGAVLVPGEALTADSIVENFGGTAGEYNASLRVNAVVRESRTGTLGPREATTVTFTERFEAVGEYTISVGNAERAVTVREPAEAVVTAFDADETELRSGESVTLSARIENEATYPGERVVPLHKNGERLTEETVRLDADSNRTVEFTVDVEEEGTFVFDLGETSHRTVTVTVSEPATDVSDTTVDDTERTDSDDVQPASSTFLMVGVFLLLLVSLFAFAAGRRYERE